VAVDDLTGRSFSHYRILQKIGGGGMGVVYEAEDTRLGRHVALKFLPEHLLNDNTNLERFQREARSTSQLNHPNICTIFDVDEFECRPVIVMELLEGESLRDELERSAPLAVDRLLDIGAQVADGLDAAHMDGLVHRDIKPGNIFLTRRGQAKVLDFGLAKLVGDRTLVPAGVGFPVQTEGVATASGLIPGTAAYMSPEQARGDGIDARSDIFSLGCVLYEMATGDKPFLRKNAILTVNAILHEKPISPLTINPALPTDIESIVGKCLEKDRERRYRNAATLRDDLQYVHRELQSGVRPTTLPGAARTFRARSIFSTYLLLAAAGVLVAVLLGLGAWWATRGRHLVQPGARRTVAVLPFRNVSGDPSQDYLRFALSDEISTILTYTPQVETRPVELSERYTGANVNAGDAGRSLKVDTVITGHYLKEGNDLHVTLEAVNVATNTVAWQGGAVASVNDLLSLQSQMATQIRTGLLPALGIKAGAVESATRPTNAEAYSLYLRSVAMPHDPFPNEEAIVLLERVVGMDPTYAPAWEQLGLRYYFEASYAGGGATFVDRSDAAFEKALSLDPNLASAASHLIENRVERGEVASAYVDAEALVKRRPDNAQAHFTLAYVLRFAGLLDESAHECDAALALDPSNFYFRSCSITFEQLDKPAHALDFLRLDAGSEWANNILPGILLRQGKREAAIAAASRMTSNDTWFGELHEACLQGRPMEQIDRLTRASLPIMLQLRDPELKYLHGSMLAFCGESDAAFQLLHSAINEEYCATTALEIDPLLSSLRKSPAFASLRADAATCQQNFIAETQKLEKAAREQGVSPPANGP
jgi:TolB-like protein